MNSLEKCRKQISSLHLFAFFSLKLVFLSDRTDSTVVSEPQIPFAKIVPMSNNIYSKLSNHHDQLVIHFQVKQSPKNSKISLFLFLKSLACRPELHEYTKYAYDLFSNQLTNQTGHSFFPLGSTSASLQSNLSSFLQSLMSP